MSFGVRQLGLLSGINLISTRIANHYGRFKLQQGQGISIMSGKPAKTEGGETSATGEEAGFPGAQLPKLTASEFRQYNTLAEHMDHFHNGFRLSWNEIYKACEANQRPKSMSLREFIAFGLRFASHLEMHHSIEESYVFPKLARKMPAFRKQDELLAQHRKIHDGLDKYTAYLKECQSGERVLVLRELKATMELFGEVLWQHLDDEVKQLGAENMRKYWTLADMKGLAF